MSQPEQPEVAPNGGPLKDLALEQLRAMYATLKVEAMPLLTHFIWLKSELEKVSGPLNALADRAAAVLVAMGYDLKTAEDRIKKWRASAESR